MKKSLYFIGLMFAAAAAQAAVLGKEVGYRADGMALKEGYIAYDDAAQVAAFRQKMDKAGVTYKAVTYRGAKHALTDPEADKYGQEFKLPLAYNAAADKASWDEGLAFLADAFKAK